MKYSREFIQKLKQSISLIDLVGRYTVLTKSGNMWIGKCPHPDHVDDTPSFRIWKNSDGTQSWACMACHSGKKDTSNHNYGSDCFAFVQWMSDNSHSVHVLTWKESIEFLMNLYDIPVQQTKDDLLLNELRNDTVRYSIALDKSDDCKKYLETRGLSGSDISEWFIGYDGHRIVFPIFNRSNDVVGFSKRLLNGDGPKYLTSETSSVFKKSNNFYGQHRLTNDKNLYIVEGVFDVIMASKYGISNVVCPLGHDLSDEQADKIKEWGYHPVLCFDNDPAGIRGITSSIENLAKRGIYASVLILPNGMDMADLARQTRSWTIDYIRSHTMQYWEWMIQKPKQVYDIQLNELKRNIVPILLRMKTSIHTDEDRIVFAQYVKDNFNIDIGVFNENIII